MADARRARPLLGTLVEIHARAEFGEASLLAAIDAAFVRIAEVHRLMSVHEPASEVSWLNREAHLRAIPASVMTWTVLQAAQSFSEDSDGAFDAVVGGRLQTLGLLPPTEPQADSAACWRDVVMDDNRAVRFRCPLRLDLGGIAKGYAVDCAIEALREAGVESALVNAGGDLRVLGAAPQSVQIRDTRDPACSAHSLMLIERALATSTTYFSRRQRIDGTVSSLIEPRNGLPYIGHDSVSVSAPSCMTADALTKVVLFASAERSERVLDKYEAQAFIQRGDDDGQAR